MKDFSKTIALCCPICGEASFSSMNVDINDEELSDAPNSVRVQCDNCKQIFTKQQIIDANSGLIAQNIEELENEIAKEVDKKLQDVLMKKDNMNI